MYGDASKKEIIDRQKKVLGQNIKKRRKELDLSQEELGLRLGADQAYVSRLEAGLLNPTLESLVEVAESLEVPVSRIVSQNR